MNTANPRSEELLPFAQRPHPFEYELYFGV